MKNPFYCFILIGLIFTSCLGQSSDKFKSVTAQEFFTSLSKESNVQLLDVRSPQEYASSHLNKSLNVNWNGDTFTNQVQKLDTAKPVYIYCQAGGRSKKACNKLHEMGFKTIIELNGGISDWETKNLPTVK